MSKISSITLFHFLKKKEWLFAILKEMNMPPRYVLEYYPTFKEHHLIPMKCFCDIPLSNIVHHTNTYGKYGIGLKKEFAFRNYINPVQYVHGDSDYVYTLMSIDFKNEQDFSFLIPYIKYMFSDDGKSNYYNEREWRYISGKTVNVKNKSLDEINKIQEELNSNINDSLKINFDDIEYIFVENDSDVKLLLAEIENFKLGRLKKNILISKIITVEQIERDF